MVIHSISPIIEIHNRPLVQEPAQLAPIATHSSQYLLHFGGFEADHMDTLETKPLKLSDHWSNAVSKSPIGQHLDTLHIDELHKVVSGLCAFDESVLEIRAFKRLLNTLNIETIEYKGGEVKNVRSKSHARYAFKHFVKIVMSPVIDFMVADTTSELPPIVPQAIEFIGKELEGLVLAPLQDLAFSDFIEFVDSQIFFKFLQVRVPHQSIEQAIAHVVPIPLSPSHALAYCLCCSDLIVKVVGRSWATQIASATLEFIAEEQRSPLNFEEHLKGVTFDLVNALAPAAEVILPNDEPAKPPPKKRSRTSEAISKTIDDTTLQVRSMLVNRAALSRFPKSILEADVLIKQLKEKSKTSDNLDDSDLDDSLEGMLVSRQSLSKHLFVIDCALDSFISDDLYEQRLAGRFGGVCIATDESPPSEPRFRGLRFQITMLYIPVFEPREQWENFNEPPMRTRCLLADILHSPGKKGVDLLKVLDKQLGRFGLSRADVIGGVADAGGENIGQSGLHAALEEANPSYVGRRCVPHIAWRVASASMVPCEDLCKDIKSLASYLAQGITWRRLRSIATSPVETLCLPSS